MTKKSDKTDAAAKKTPPKNVGTVAAKSTSTVPAVIAAVSAKKRAPTLNNKTVAKRPARARRPTAKALVPKVKPPETSKRAILETVRRQAHEAMQQNNGRLPHKWMDYKLEELRNVAPWMTRDHIKYQLRKLKKHKGFQPDGAAVGGSSSRSNESATTTAVTTAASSTAATTTHTAAATAAPPLSEKQKMMAGQLYQAFDKQLLQERNEAKQLCFRLNQTSPLDLKQRKALTKMIVGKADALLESPFYCDYGYNITVGKNFYANHGCTILDCNRIKIGNNCLLAPNVVITAATHPLDAGLRQRGDELTAPVTIGNNVWIGANATICQGVTLGDNVVVGAGAVVNKSMPANVVCGGVPVKIIRHLTEQEKRKKTKK